MVIGGNRSSVIAPIASRTCTWTAAIRPTGTQTPVPEHTRAFALPGVRQG
jgi:hypothetical protein